ncbi:hypothetical protein, partial [Idiomarina sp.]|uniref:hypothetical protein n=1 Tax=Idiomarina sp. TaxID=1874361 RepID=UPI00258B835B
PYSPIELMLRSVFDNQYHASYCTPALSNENSNIEQQGSHGVHQKANHCFLNAHSEGFQLFKIIVQ